MSAFPLNKWDTNEVGDKLSKELFKKDKKKFKKTRNSKLDNVEVKKNIIKIKNLVENNIKISDQTQIDIKNGKNINKRKRKISNIDNNFNNTKKLKISGKHIDKINNHVEKGNNKKIKNQYQITDKTKKNMTIHGITDEHDKKSKLIKKEKKEKKEKLKNNNINSQQIGKMMNIKKIEEMLMKKKNESKNVMNKPETLRDRMMAQLRASRFRYLNETLYNNQSFESRKMFKEDPDAFHAYHIGYRQQIEHWPMNPLDIIISAIKKMPKDYIIADFGCGEARLAESVEQKVYSLDLIAVNEKVIACDMAHTSLLTNGIHVVVFCLSLMGSNLSDYILEANRVLKNDGILKIADVESRFENIDEFIKSISCYGFKNTWKDLSHNLFYFMDFKKISDVNRKNKKLPIISLKSCLYKKR